MLLLILSHIYLVHVILLDYFFSLNMFTLWTVSHLIYFIIHSIYNYNVVYKLVQTIYFNSMRLHWSEIESLPLRFIVQCILY